jgi:hypothetical protein
VSNKADLAGLRDDITNNCNPVKGKESPYGEEWKTSEELKDDISEIKKEKGEKGCADSVLWSNLRLLWVVNFFSQREGAGPVWKMLVEMQFFGTTERKLEECWLPNLIEITNVAKHDHLDIPSPKEIADQLWELRRGAKEDEGGWWYSDRLLFFCVSSQTFFKSSFF